MMRLHWLQLTLELPWALQVCTSPRIYEWTMNGQCFTQHAARTLSDVARDSAWLLCLPCPNVCMYKLHLARMFACDLCQRNKLFHCLTPGSSAPCLLVYFGMCTPCVNFICSRFHLSAMTCDAHVLPKLCRGSKHVADMLMVQRHMSMALHVQEQRWLLMLQTWHCSQTICVAYPTSSCLAEMQSGKFYSISASQ